MQLANVSNTKVNQNAAGTGESAERTRWFHDISVEMIRNEHIIPRDLCFFLTRLIRSPHKKKTSCFDRKLAALVPGASHIPNKLAQYGRSNAQERNWRLLPSKDSTSACLLRSSSWHGITKHCHKTILVSRLAEKSLREVAFLTERNARNKLCNQGSSKLHAFNMPIGL